MTIEISGTQGVTFPDGSTQSTKAPLPFRNKVINGNFDIFQRGSSLASGTGERYLADRFFVYSVGTTYTNSAQGFSIQSEVPKARNFLRTAVSSVAGAGNLALLRTKIEDVRTLAGKKATISFWAKADAAKTIAVDFDQQYGTGGTPSPYNVFGLKKFTLGTVWTKFTYTTDVPSVAGKTLGTNGNSYLMFNVWFDAGTDWAARTDSLGHQSGTFDVAQIQIEEGSVATEFEDRPLGLEFDLCRRFARRVGNIALPLTQANQGATDRNSGLFIHSPPMRSVPSTALASGGWSFEGHHTSVPTISNAMNGTRFEFFGADFRATSGVLHADVMFSAEL